ncbi:uncharacterized protein LOC132207636 [Stegostoma tigrinum]|uniref:uncharacterized protein LOC132207636 n=1 Tax=Stegostoma tigrinum TaxID=3053191 RepID=UPI00287021BD|nr:uncharacterized protein LOC132207636 [Stegostoma tigrinum]
MGLRNLSAMTKWQNRLNGPNGLISAPMSYGFVVLNNCRSKTFDSPNSEKDEEPSSPKETATISNSGNVDSANGEENGSCVSSGSSEIIAEYGSFDTSEAEEIPVIDSVNTNIGNNDNILSCEELENPIPPKTVAEIRKPSAGSETWRPWPIPAVTNTEIAAGVTHQLTVWISFDSCWSSERDGRSASFSAQLLMLIVTEVVYALSLERVQRRFMRMVQGMESLKYEERLRTLRLYSLEIRWMRGDLIETFRILNGLDRVDVGKMLSLVGETRTRGPTFRIKRRSFQLEIWRNLFSQRVLNL